MIRFLGSVHAWQVLRKLVRAGGPLLGRELRIYPNQRTKDGTFLDDLVVAGLLEAVGGPEPDRPQVAGGHVPTTPAQLRTRYRLTEQGTHAAEFGEYEFDFDSHRKAAQAKGGAG